SSRRRHTRCLSDWSSDVCSSDLSLRFLRLAIAILTPGLALAGGAPPNPNFSCVTTPDSTAAASSNPIVGLTLLGNFADAGTCSVRGFIPKGTQRVGVHSRDLYFESCTLYQIPSSQC